MSEEVDLEQWLAQVCVALNVPVELAAHRQLLLDVARDAAHGVMRPAAPLTTFLVGYAAGRAGDAVADPSALFEAAAVATAAATHWRATDA